MDFFFSADFFAFDLISVGFVGLLHSTEQALLIDYHGITFF